VFDNRSGLVGRGLGSQPEHDGLVGGEFDGIDGALDRLARVHAAEGEHVAVVFDPQFGALVSALDTAEGDHEHVVDNRSGTGNDVNRDVEFALVTDLGVPVAVRRVRRNQVQPRLVVRVEFVPFPVGRERTGR